MPTLSLLFLIPVSLAAVSTWESLEEQGIKALRRGDAQVAAAVFERAIEASSSESAGRIEQARLLEFLSDAYRGARDPRAAPTLERAMELVVAEQGEESAELAPIFDRKAEFLYGERNYPAAKEWYVRALHLRLKAFGPEHPEVSKSYRLLGAFAESQGNRQEAEALYLQALKLVEGSGGEGEGDVLSLLSGFYRRAGDTAKAKEFSARAISWFSQHE